MRVVHRVYAQLSRDVAQKQQLWLADPALSEVVTDQFQRCVGGLDEVAVVSTQVLSLGDVQDVRGLYLEADRTCRVRLNGSADPLVLQPAEAGKPAKLFVEATITQVTVENLSAVNPVQVAYVVWGDPLSV